MTACRLSRTPICVLVWRPKLSRSVRSRNIGLGRGQYFGIHKNFLHQLLSAIPVMKKALTKKKEFRLRWVIFFNFWIHTQDVFSMFSCWQKIWERSSGGESPGCNRENNCRANFSARVSDVPFCFSHRVCCRFRFGNLQDQKREIGARKDKAGVRLRNAFLASWSVQTEVYDREILA